MTEKVKPTDIDNMMDYQTFVSSEPDEFTRKMKFLVWFNKQMEKKGYLSTNAVLTGGLAVQLYTGGGYITVDIDILSDDSTIIDNILLPVGFEKDGRYWYNDDDSIVLEAPGIYEDQKIVTINFDYGTIKAVSPEYMIIDRLNGYKWWNCNNDYNQAKTMLINNINNLDIDYLYNYAEKENVKDILDKLIKEIKGKN